MIERKIIAYKNYYKDFIQSLSAGERKKVHYGLDLLASRDRINTKFVKHLRDGLYELRVEYESNIYRIFFCFDNDRIVVLFNGFQKRTDKTPEKEIQKALKLKKEYYASK